MGDVMFIPEGEFLQMLPIDPDRSASVWESPFVTDGTSRSAPAVAGDTVYVGSDDRKLYAVDIPTGRERWSWKTGNWVRSSPVVVDGLVIVASGDGTVAAIGEKPTAAP
jgi:outer membrane protein assembly factor BamB